MWNPEAYSFHFSASPERDCASHASTILDKVWRFDFSAPGFCVVDLGTNIDSHRLRSLMLDLKSHLDKAAIQKHGVRFDFRSMGRFDQQVTTKFHLDGGPERSMLMLGYEPSQVRSRLSLADYSRCAHDLGIEPKRFLDEFNPMFRAGDEQLAPYVTELPEPSGGHSRILLINNSWLPFVEDRMNPLGVLHKAEILEPDESQRRIVNSVMLTVGAGDLLSQEAIQEFVSKDGIANGVEG